MPPILQQRSTVIALVLLVVGLCFNIAGKNFSSDKMSAVQQAIGCLFDILAVNIPYFMNLHNQTAAKLEDHIDLPATEAHPPEPESMGKILTIILVMGVTLLSIGSSGCTADGKLALLNGNLSDADKVAQAEGVYTGALQVLITAEQTHTISPQDYHAAMNIARTINSGFNQVHVDLKAGAKLDKSEAWSVIQTALNQFLVYKWSVNHGPSDTRPSSHRDRIETIDPARFALGEWRPTYRRAAGRSLLAA